MKFNPSFLVIPFLVFFTSCKDEVNLKNTNYPFADFNVTYKSSIAPLTSTQIDQSPWGIHFNGMPFHDMAFAQYDSLDIEQLQKELPALIELTSDLGIKWARISVDWGLIEDMRGEFHWELLDPMIEGLVSSGIEVYPSLHAGHVKHTNKMPPTTQVEIEAWLNFVEKVIDRYKDKITYWEIWNEPNTTWFWGGAPNAVEYYHLVDTSSRLIKKTDPDSKVIGGSLARLDVPYAQELFELGIAKAIDIFSFHPYGVFPEAAIKKMKVQVKMPLLYEPVMNTVDGLQQLIENSGKPIELWQGECGYPSAMNGGGWNGTGPYSEEIQAKWILRRAFVDLSYDAKVSAYFLLKEIKHKHYEHYNRKGLLKFHDLSPKKGYAVFQNLTSTIHGPFKKENSISIEADILDEGELFGIRPKNIRTLSLKKDDEIMMAYWGVTHMQSDVKHGKVQLEIKGIDAHSIQTIELIDLYSGDLFSVNNFKSTDEGLIISGLPLNDYPFVLKVK